MAQTLTLDRPMTNKDSAAPSCHPMPLSFLKSGEAARVVKMRCKGDLHHHLENLGFVEGAPLSVVCENAGNIIVEIKGAQVALDRSVAQRIITG